MNALFTHQVNALFTHQVKALFTQVVKALFTQVVKALFTQAVKALFTQAVKAHHPTRRLAKYLTGYHTDTKPTASTVTKMRMMSSGCTLTG